MTIKNFKSPNANKNKKKFNIFEIKKNISKFDTSYTHERKIKFLLDIRGYLLINKIRGNYIEFGSFLSEMQVSAFVILERTKCMFNFFGVDIFKKFQGFNSSYENVKNELKKISPKLKIIKLDLSQKKNMKKIDYPINVSVIDCNEKKSLVNSLEHSIRNMTNGGIIYIDDYFVLDRNNILLKSHIKKFLIKYKKKYEFFKTYPPFGLAIIILNKKYKLKIKLK